MANIDGRVIDDGRVNILVRVGETDKHRFAEIVRRCSADLLDLGGVDRYAAQDDGIREVHERCALQTGRRTCGFLEGAAAGREYAGQLDTCRTAGDRSDDIDDVTRLCRCNIRRVQIIKPGLVGDDGPRRRRQCGRRAQQYEQERRETKVPG